MVQKTAKLGGTASDVVVARAGHGLMMMTRTLHPISDEQAFEAIKAGIDDLLPNTKMILNSAEFYGVNPETYNLQLLSRFFEKYPSYTDKAFLCVKGGLKAGAPTADSSPENLRRSVETCVSCLRGMKKIDLFESARVDPNYPIEETVKVLSGFVKEGLFDHVGLSECAAETVRKANKVYPIAAVEIEVSPWSYEDETKKVISTCKELGIAVVGYSPLGRGFLTGKITRPEDMAADDFRHKMTRFQAENIKHNFAIVDALKAIADKKGVSTAQISIAWVASRGPHVIPLPGSSHKARTLENLAGADVDLTSEEVKQIDEFLEAHPVMGSRYVDQLSKEALQLWG